MNKPKGTEKKKREKTKATVRRICISSEVSAGSTDRKRNVESVFPAISPTIDGPLKAKQAS
jgi:hypothetical protein